MLDQILQIKQAIAFLGPQIAAREQAAEFCPPGAIARVGENVRRAVAKYEPRTGMITQRKLGLAFGQMRAHDARHGVAIA